MRTAHEEIALLKTENEQLNAEVIQLQEQVLALEEARDRYADLYDFVAVACLMLDGNGVIREANRRTVSLLRYHSLRLLGAPLMTLVVREHRRRFLEHLAICRAGVDAVTVDLALTPYEGKRIPVRVTIRSNRELGAGYAVAMVDMRAMEAAHAEQRRLVILEREAQIDNQVKSRWVTKLSVELRGLLSAVQRAGREASDHADLPHAMRLPLGKLLDSVSTLLRRVTRLTSGRLRPVQSDRQSRKVGRRRVPRLRAQK
jgi:PAS domain S-box-containing protein